ncbi:MAG: Ferric uptake regulation protein [Phycisphaerae bacterium]|nr:Ferric uptake regulation protein [Phycisphaerae bacterium]
MSPARREQIGQRKTQQRDAIAAVIRQSDGPLTIVEIHLRARRRVAGRQLGIATVYRTVNLLLQREVIHSVILGDGQTRYESAGLDHHHHFRCRVCRTVYDLPGCMLDPPAGARLPAGFRVETHELTLYGTCPRCSRPPRRANR